MKFTKLQIFVVIALIACSSSKSYLEFRAKLTCLNQNIDCVNSERCLNIQKRFYSCVGSKISKGEENCWGFSALEQSVKSTAPADGGIHEQITADWIGCINSCNDLANNDIDDRQYIALMNCKLDASGSYLKMMLSALVALSALVFV